MREGLEETRGRNKSGVKRRKKKEGNGMRVNGEGERKKREQGIRVG